MLRSTTARVSGVLAAAALWIVASCAVNPVTGKHELTLLSESQEIALGAESDPQIVAEYGLYDDPRVQAYVDSIGQRMAHRSHRPDLKFTFRVLDSPVINAFALPGGYIYITRGILAHMNDEAELAVVVGHEIGHVTARHGVEQYTRQQIAGVGLGLAAVWSTRVAEFGQVLQQGLGLMFLKYGRADETQADELGVEYALRAGFDAEAGAKFFEVLDRQTKESGQSLPEWLSTHPAPEGRVRRTRDLAVARKPQFPQSTRIAANEHKARVDGIVFGDDPRQGFQDGDVFKHPGLRFQVTLPAGWQVQNTPSALLAGTPDQSALLRLTLEKSDGLGPSQYAAQLAQSVRATVVQSSAERIHGFDGYTAVMRVDDGAGNTQDVQTGFVQRERGGAIYRFVGMSSPATFAAARTAFLGSIRSLQPLTDRAALDMTPNRVQVETVRSATTLQQAVDRAGGSPVPLATVALVNNLQPASVLAAGFRVKLVRGTYHPKTAAP